MNYQELSNKNILVTAGASGIGFEIAKLLSENNANVVICDINDERLDFIKNNYSNIYPYKCNVAVYDDCKTFIDSVIDKFGYIDYLVNNAGIAGPTKGIEEIDIDEWRSCLDIGLTSQFIFCKLLSSTMIKRKSGAIINMSSAAGKYGYAYRSPYSSAKFGVIGLTQSLAKELGKHNIRVNAILPGIVAGERMNNVIENRAKELNLSFDEMKDKYLQNVSMGVMVEPHDIAHMVAFLLSERAAYVSGESISVGGNVENI